MKYLRLVILAAIVLLSFMAGGAKVTHAEQEVSFFQQTGVSLQLLLPFGALQILAGLLALLSRIRKLGLWLMAIMFGLSAAMIFTTGNIAFALFSLVPCSDRDFSDPVDTRKG